MEKEQSQGVGGDLSETGLSQCLFCSRWRGGGACEAYTGEPYLVPVVILDNTADHRDSYPGDNGLRFSPKDEDAARLQDRAIERARVGNILYRKGFKDRQGGK